MLRRLFVLSALAVGCSARPAATVQQVPSTSELRFEIAAVDPQTEEGKSLLDRKKAEEPPPATPEDIQLLREIRDSLARR